MTARSIRGAVWLAGAGLALTAAPAIATEGPPGGGQPLPNTLQPVAIPQTAVTPAPAPVPAQPGRAKRPRVMQARLTPRKVHSGRRTRLRVSLATSGRVRVLVERNVRGHRVRAWVRTVTAPGTSLTVRLPARLRAGRYRVTVVSVDAQGQSSRPVRRALVVVRR